MLRIAVCDDEQLYLHEMMQLLSEYRQSGALGDFSVSCFAAPSELLDSLEKGSNYGLYLLDIYLPGITGIAVAQQLRSAGVEAPIIFLTTSREHALEAFGVGASQYLLKPFERQALFSALDATAAAALAERRQHLLIKVDGEVCSIAVRNILYTQSDKNRQVLHLAGGRELAVRMTVGELFQLLAASNAFVRCGSSYILNLAKLKRLSPKYAILSDGTEISIPRGAYPEIKTSYYGFYSER